MNKQRMKLMEQQARAFLEGTIEKINDQWIFFDKDTEEAFLLNEFSHHSIERFRNNKWEKCPLYGEDLEQLSEDFPFEDGDFIRIRKNLVYSLEKLLEEISDDSFYQFISLLNSLNFSIYDCIYCYNHLTFLRPYKRKEGVNFIIFDNGEEICNIQHHFRYFHKQNDRFEYTLSSGKRTVIEKISPA